MAALAAGALWLPAIRHAATRTPSAIRWAAASVAVAIAGFLVVPAELTSVKPGETLLARAEDAYGVFQAVRLPSGLILVTNNRTELVFYLGHRITSFVQEMQGHLGMFHVPDARRALVIGSGYGITAGALGLYPQLERIDAVEILPAMVAAAPLFEPFVHGYHKNPRVQVVTDDGRHFVARSRERWDIVSINVSDPHLPGSAGLFHTDFLQSLREHLTEKGVVVIHIFGTDRDVLLRTVFTVFPYVRLYRAYENGYNVVAAFQPFRDRPAEQTSCSTSRRSATRSGGSALRPEFSRAHSSPRRSARRASVRSGQRRRSHPTRTPSSNSR